MTEQVVEIPVKQPSKSWAQQVVSSLLKRTSAKIGLAWIGLLVVIATFSPFLASSHPIYLVIDGQASSPLLKHMQALDWIWLSGFFITLVISAFSLVAWKKILLWLASIAVVSVIAYATVSPPILVVYEHYRELEAEGKVEKIIRAPIPYSAKDYLRDYADTGIESPLSAQNRSI
jgi:peptide/nickel transport system permease protein